MNRLLHSAKFWTAIVDALVSSLAIVLAFWLTPDKVNQILGVIALWQPVIAVVIAAFAYEDAAVIRAGGVPGGTTVVTPPQ